MISRIKHSVRRIPKHLTVSDAARIGTAGAFALAWGLYLYCLWLWTIFSPASLNLLNGAANILSNDGTVLRTVYQEQPARYSEVKLKEVPIDCRKAVIAAEDRWFYSHIGVDAGGTARLLLNALPGQQQTGGGSTIPQQLVKLGMGRVLGRTLIDKVHEILLSVRLTTQLSKDQILELYLNNAYYGNFIYGIKTASEAYLGKPVQDLNLAECAYLAGLPQSPSIYNPTVKKELGLQRKDTVLDLMLRSNAITQEQFDAARAQEIAFNITKYEVRAPQFIEFLAYNIAELQPEIGVINWNLPLDINTTYDWQRHQQALLELRLEVIKAQQSQIQPGNVITETQSNEQNSEGNPATGPLESTASVIDAAEIIIDRGGAVRVFIGTTDFTGAAQPQNLATQKFAGVSLWDLARAYVADKFGVQPYLVEKMENRNTSEVKLHEEKNIEAEVIEDTAFESENFTLQTIDSLSAEELREGLTLACGCEILVSSSDEVTIFQLFQ